MTEKLKGIIKISNKDYKQRQQKYDLWLFGHKPIQPATPPNNTPNNTNLSGYESLPPFP